MNFFWLTTLVLIAGVVCDDLTVDEKRACAERHLKKSGTLENDFHSAYSHNDVTDAHCEAYIKSISKTYVDKLKVNFAANPQTAPIVDCIVSGMASHKATEYDIAVNYFDSQHLNDQARETKYKAALADIVKGAVHKCADEAGH